ncbi:MAG: hypothetical protein AABY14_02070 [Nanoarchaeota archaeon]
MKSESLIRRLIFLMVLIFIIGCASDKSDKVFDEAIDIIQDTRQVQEDMINENKKYIPTKTESDDKNQLDAKDSDDKSLIECSRFITSVDDLVFDNFGDLKFASKLTGTSTDLMQKLDNPEGTFDIVRFDSIFVVNYNNQVGGNYNLDTYKLFAVKMFELAGDSEYNRYKDYLEKSLQDLKIRQNGLLEDIKIRGSAGKKLYISEIPNSKKAESQRLGSFIFIPELRVIYNLASNGNIELDEANKLIVTFFNKLCNKIV